MRFFKIALVSALLIAAFFHLQGCGGGNPVGAGDTTGPVTGTITTENPAGTTEITLNAQTGLKMYFAEIPAGTFQMGKVGVADPVHSVTISKAFYMGKHEVTQAQYKEIMGANPSHFTSANSYANTDQQPVELVSWYDSVRFSNALSANQSLAPCYTNQSGNTTIADRDTVTCNWSANGYRLPTEAEWELACRGSSTNTTTYYWGSDSSEATVKQYAWCSSNAYDSYWTSPHAEKSGTQPVGTKLPNAFGLYDMSGNVWEWCYDSYYDYSPGAQTDPRGAEGGFNCVSRGGCWFSDPYSLGSASRAGGRMTYRSSALGFRLVRTK